MEQYTIKKRGLNNEVAMIGDTIYYTRRIGQTEWQPYTGPQPTADTSQAVEGPLLLYVVRQRQPPPNGTHWLLFVARDGQPGTIYQVYGDHEFMTHNHRKNVNVSASSSFQDMYQIATLDDKRAALVQHNVNAEPAPRANSAAEVRETCQSWTLRVLYRLVEQGIVHREWYDRLYKMVDSPVILRLRAQSSGGQRSGGRSSGSQSSGSQRSGGQNSGSRSSRSSRR